MQILTDAKSISNESEFFPLLPEGWGDHVDLKDVDLFVAAGAELTNYGVCLLYCGVNIAESVNGGEPFIKDEDLYEELIGVLDDLVSNAMSHISEEEYMGRVEERLIDEWRTEKKAKAPKSGRNSDDGEYFKVDKIDDSITKWQSDVHWDTDVLKSIYETYAKQYWIDE